MATNDTKTPATTDAQPAEKKQPESDYDVMAGVFDELMEPESSSTDEGESSTSKGEGEKAPEAKGDEKKPEEKKPAEAKEPEGEKPADKKEGDESADDKPDGEDAEPAAGDKEPPQDAAYWKKKHDDLVAAQKPAPVVEDKPEDKKPEDKKSEPEQKLYAPDEEEFLSSYDKEWPDVIKGEALKRRGEYNQLTRHIFSEINRVWGPLLERGVLAADTVAETTALSVIRAAHDDYDDKMYDDVLAWADTLKGTKQKIVKATIETGDPDEVVDLITEFKTVTGRNKPKVVATEGEKKQQPAAKSTVTELSPKAKQAAKAMSVVDSKRTDPTQATPDANDFDSAWDEAIGADGK